MILTLLGVEVIGSLSMGLRQLQQHNRGYFSNVLATFLKKLKNEPAPNAGSFFICTLTECVRCAQDYTKPLTSIMFQTPWPSMFYGSSLASAKNVM